MFSVAIQRSVFHTLPRKSCLTSRFFHASRATELAKLNVEGLAEKVDLKGQNVLVRVDLNVPLSKVDDKTVTDTTRLRAIVPTTKFLLEKGANVLLCSHFGRPKGNVIETGKNGRLNPVIPHLTELLGTDIKKMDDCIGPEVESAASKLTEGEVLVLENTRFHAGETKNDDELAMGLGKLADYFVMDAFGTSHRAHSSTAGVTNHMKLSAAGYLLDKELKFLKAAVNNPERPLCAIVGGAKVSTKIPVIESLIDKCDTILLGGGMIFTFYKALGYDVGNSIVEPDFIELASKLLEKAEKKGVELVLPTDVVLADMFSNEANTAVAKSDEISGEWLGLDIGPETIDTFEKYIEKSNTIVFNGPMGVFEFKNFAKGTDSVAQFMAQATDRGAITIVGGGDSVAAVNSAGLGDKVSHISTGGGASLELLEGKELPGVTALSDA